MSSSLPVERKCKLAACRRTRDFRVDAKLDPPVAALQWQHAFMPSKDCYFCCYCCLVLFYLCISFLSCSPKWLACTEVLASDDFCCTLLRVNFFFSFVHLS